MSRPPWVVLDHAGWVVRTAPTAGDAAAALGIALLAAVWSALVCLGTASAGPGDGAALACGWVLVPFLGLLAAGMVGSLFVRRELRLRADGVILTTTRFGIPSRIALPLRTLSVEGGQLEGSRGRTHVWVELVSGEGGAPRRARMPLPDGAWYTDRPRVLRERDWLVDALRAAAEAARALPDGAAPTPEALRALVERAR